MRFLYVWPLLTMQIKKRHKGTWLIVHTIPYITYFYFPSHKLITFDCLLKYSINIFEQRLNGLNCINLRTSSPHPWAETHTHGVKISMICQIKLDKSWEHALCTINSLAYYPPLKALRETQNVMDGNNAKCHVDGSDRRFHTRNSFRFRVINMTDFSLDQNYTKSLMNETLSLYIWNW